MDEIDIIGPTCKVILAGTSQYTADKESYGDRLNIENNIKSLKKYFCDPDIIGIPSANVLPILNSPSPSEFHKNIREWCGDARTLIFYYSGHASKLGESLYLTLPTSERNEDALKNSAVNFDDVKNTIKNSGAARRIVILDCCYAAYADDDLSDIRSAFSTAAVIEDSEDETDSGGKKGTYYAYAAPAREEAKDKHDDGEHTIFTGALVDVLKDGLDTKPAVLSVHEVFEAVRDKVKREYKDKAPIPIPFPKGPSIGGFRFAYNQKHVDSDQRIRTIVSEELERKFGELQLPELDGIPSDLAQLKTSLDAKIPRLQEAQDWSKLMSNSALCLGLLGLLVGTTGLGIGSFSASQSNLEVAEKSVEEIGQRIDLIEGKVNEKGDGQGLAKVEFDVAQILNEPLNSKERAIEGAIDTLVLVDSDRKLANLIQSLHLGDPIVHKGFQQDLEQVEETLGSYFSLAFGLKSSEAEGQKEKDVLRHLEIPDSMKFNFYLANRLRGIYEDEAIDVLADIEPTLGLRKSGSTEAKREQFVDTPRQELLLRTLWAFCVYKSESQNRSERKADIKRLRQWFEKAKVAAAQHEIGLPFNILFSAITKEAIADMKKVGEGNNIQEKTKLLDELNRSVGYLNEFERLAASNSGRVQNNRAWVGVVALDWQSKDYISVDDLSKFVVENLVPKEERTTDESRDGDEATAEKPKESEPEKLDPKLEEVKKLKLIFKTIQDLIDKAIKQKSIEAHATEAEFFRTRFTKSKNASDLNSASAAIEEWAKKMKASNKTLEKTLASLAKQEYLQKVNKSQELPNGFFPKELVSKIFDTN